MLASDYMENLKASGNNIYLIAVCLCGKVCLDFLKNEDRFGLKNAIQKRQFKSRYSANELPQANNISVDIKKVRLKKKPFCFFKACR